MVRLGGLVSTRPATTTRWAGARRAVLGVTSQVLNSLSNLALALLVARHSSPADFGGWGIAFAFYVFILQIARATGSMPVMLTAGDEDAQTPRGSVSMSAAVGVVSGLLFLAAAPFVSASIGDALVAMGVLLPVLYVQDSLRYWYIQQTKPSGAAVLDAVWLAVFAVAAAVLMA